MAITIAVNKVSNNISISTDDVVISTAEVVQPITVNTAIPSVVFDASYLAVTPSGIVTATNVQGAIDQLAAVTEANDLTTSVTWADVPDANITESSVVQYITSANVSAAGAAMLTGADFTGDVTITNGELTVNGSAEAELFKGDIEGAVHFKGAVASGATLTKGDVVYISGHSGQKTEVDLADASDSNKMPAFGIVAADPVGVNVDVVTFGTLKSINTSAYTDGDELYVDTTAGGLTATAPSGESNLVQKIAKVVKAHNSGNIKVMGAGRTNATPNLDDGNIFIGDSNNQSVTASLATQVSALETSHNDVLVDGDFTSNGLMKRDGAGVYSVDSSTYATETYVDTAVSNLVDSAPATLDTLNELASALGDDANFSTTVSNSIGTKWTEDATKINNWDTAYSWGDHSIEGYLTTFDITTQTDPKYLRADASDTSTGTISANSFSSTLGFSSQYGGISSQGGDFVTSTGDITTSTGTVSGATISGTTFTCNGNMTVGGTVDGVDVSALATTANSAMQDLVDDTTPQLGGGLDLNGNNIIGTGNISITQASTTVPALTLTSTDDGAVESPTMRLIRNSASQEDSDQIGQIEFYGKVGSSAIREYAGIKAVLNDVAPSSYDGQLDFYTRKNSAETKLMSLTPTTLELTNGTDLDVAGDITVGGTVDGVDLATTIVDGDFTSNGFMKRTGAGTYTVDTSSYVTTGGGTFNGNVTVSGTPPSGQGTLTAHFLRGNTNTGGSNTPVLDLEKNVTGINGSGRFIEFNTKHHSTGSIVTRGHLGINQSSYNGTAHPYFSHNDGNCGFALTYSGSSSFNSIIPASTTGASTSSNINLGHQYARWNGVYLKISPNVSSDREYKRDIEELSEAEKRVAVACKGLIRKYRMKDAYEEKGESARLHIGIIAQDLQDAFTAEGLDAHRYGMFCSDTWHQATVTTKDEDGNVTTSVEDFELVEHAPEGATNITEITRLSVRYEELLAFIISTT